MAKMAKFGQNVDFGLAYDPPPQFETKISKSQNLPILTRFWGFDPKSGFKIAKMSKLDQNIKSGHGCNPPSKFELIRSKNKKVIQGKKEKRAPP